MGTIALDSNPLQTIPPGWLRLSREGKSRYGVGPDQLRIWVHKQLVPGVRVTVPDRRLPVWYVAPPPPEYMPPDRRRLGLTPRERAMLEMRYAAPDGTITPVAQHTYREIAAVHALSVERVRQIETRTRRKLQNSRADVTDRARYVILLAAAPARQTTQGVSS